MEGVILMNTMFWGVFNWIVIGSLIIPSWKILKRLGFNPFLSLLAVVPFANVLLLFYVGFSKWPIESD